MFNFKFFISASLLLFCFNLHAFDQTNFASPEKTLTFYHQGHEENNDKKVASCFLNPSKTLSAMGKTWKNWEILSKQTYNKKYIKKHNQRKNRPKKSFLELGDVELIMQRTVLIGTQEKKHKFLFAFRNVKGSWLIVYRFALFDYGS